MGKKRISVLGSEQEQDIKAKKAVKLEQKRLREGLPAGKAGKSAKAPGLAGGQRVVDTATESLIEYEKLQAKQSETGTSTKPKKAIRIRSKNYQAAKSKINSDTTYPLSAALQLLKAANLTKFDPTVELHINLTKSSVSTQADLPYSTGKAKRIAVADDATVSKIEANKIDFDVLFASPAQMAKLVKLAKVLGPKGLMPNPKSGTVVDNPEAAAKKLAGSNTLLLRTEKSAPLIHTIVGKLSQPEKELTANVQAVVSALAPSGITKVVLKSTMSPAIKLQI